MKQKLSVFLLFLLWAMPLCAAVQVEDVYKRQPDKSGFADVARLGYGRYYESWAHNCIFYFE